MYLGAANNPVKFGPLVLLICWLWFDQRPNQERQREKLFQALLAGTSGLVIGRALALFLPLRARPQFRSDLLLAYPLDPALRTWSAFPSDRAVFAFALAASLVRVSPTAGVWAFAHAALVIGLPRVYFGLHHPSDLLGGAMIGILAAATVAWLPEKQTGQRVVVRLQPQQPALFYAFGFLFLYEVMTMFDGLRSVANVVFDFLRHIRA